MPTVRRWIAAVFAAALCSGAAAQFPAKTVRVVIPFPGGSPSDNFARVLTTPLAQALGQPVIIENRPGADGAIGADAVIKSAPDGHTLFLSTPTAILSAPLLKKNPPYEPSVDFTPVVLLARFPIFLIVSPTLPVKTAGEFLDHARANPGKLNYASGNITAVVLAEALKKTTGINLVRVPYKSEVLTFPDLISGRVHANYSSGAVLGAVRDGKLRALAVMLERRSTLAPEVPTAVEAGLPPASITAFVGLFGPAGMPRPAVERIAREMNAILKRPDIREQCDRTGFHAEGSSPEEFVAFLKEQRELWRQAIADAGIEPD